MPDEYPVEIMTTSPELGRGERWDHARARLGFDRMGHRVPPGLYALGEPDRGSRVFVTSNYTLSFDALRSSLPGSAYILVLDTEGINVWCAAGKGTFGTEELLKAIEQTGLEGKVESRTLVLPQLGAPGVCAGEIKRRSGFKVEYGPIRAEDLPSYLRNGGCDEGMRTVRFGLRDRLVLTPVELRNYRWAMLALVLLALLVDFYGPMLLVITLGGLFLFPALLPFLPGKDLSFQGMILGAVLVTPFALVQLAGDQGLLALTLVSAEYLLSVPWVGYLALNFTGSTPFCSRTGVRREIFTYVPIMAVMAVAGAVLAMVAVLASFWGWY